MTSEFPVVKTKTTSHLCFMKTNKLSSEEKSERKRIFEKDILFIKCLIAVRSDS